MTTSQELRVTGPYDPFNDTFQRADLRETWQAELTHNMFRVDERTVTNDTIVVYVLGPTASGKSDLALQMAEQLEGAIVALDTRTLYSGMDIGTASPPFEDEFRAPHYLVGVVPYGAGSPVARRVLENGVRKSITHAVENVRLPIVTGGSVYLAEMLLYNNRLDQGISGKKYEALQRLTIAELAQYCEDSGIGLPFEPDDRERLMHHILLRNKMRRESLAITTGTLVLGVDRSKEELEERIRARTHTMMEQGLEHEILQLLRKTGGFETPLLRGTIGYREFREYVWGQRSIEEVEEAIIASTIRFAHWQQREFRDKIPHIRWVKSIDEALDAFEIHIRKVWQGRNLAKLAIGGTRPAAEDWLRRLGFQDLIPSPADAAHSGM